MFKEDQKNQDCLQPEKQGSHKNKGRRGDRLLCLVTLLDHVRNLLVCSRCDENTSENRSSL